MPVGKNPGCPPQWTRRQLIDGSPWHLRAGTLWRDIPPTYGSWQAVYGLFYCHGDGPVRLAHPRECVSW
ncbi:MAG TPA: transposase [Pseudonocardiaceae bacterium]|nr:transposase [Pseudonocardiaceae bacterium]